MAGIGFSLRATTVRGSYTFASRSLVGAAVVCGGPFTIAALAMGAIAQASVADANSIAAFRVATTWLVAGVLIWTAPLQLVLTRFLADSEYLGERGSLLPNLNAALILASVSAGALGCALAASQPSLSLALRLWLVAAFVATCNAWLVTVVLASLREHAAVLACFALAHALMAGAARACGASDVAMLLACFTAGQWVLAVSGLAVIRRDAARARGEAMPAAISGKIAWRFLRTARVLPSLALAGLAQHAGAWADELVFWLDPRVSHAALGPLRASSVYDLPNLAGSLCALPGLAVFVVHGETEFADRQRAFVDAVLSGATLTRLYTLAALLTEAARSGLWAVLRTQALVWLLCLAVGHTLLPWLAGGAPSVALQVPLFQLCGLASALQTVMLAVLSMLFYLDRRGAALAVCSVWAIANAGASRLSLSWDPAYLGTGGVLAAVAACASGIALLNHALANLVRDTFMHQPAAPA